MVDGTTRHSPPCHLFFCLALTRHTAQHAEETTLFLTGLKMSGKADKGNYERPSDSL